jgi:hypothetical protein
MIRTSRNGVPEAVQAGNGKAQTGASSFLLTNMYLGF